MKFLVPASVQRMIREALREDIGRKDFTTAALISAQARGRATIIAKSGGVISGMPLVIEVYRQLDPSVRITQIAGDKSEVRPGARVCRIEGPLHSLMTGERVALNFLGHLSGIATLTRAFVKAVRPYPVKIMDTRKTFPLLRMAQKYAVRCGGGVNHRMSLSDAVMVKDNHLEALSFDWKELGRRLKKVHGKQVIIEVDRLSDLPRAAALHPDVILLDNMSVQQVRKAVRYMRDSGGISALEVSGRVTLKKVRQYAQTGVERISIGALTHSAPHLDFSLELSPFSGVH